ncbi:MAG: popeye domain-containing protein [Alphaproteobacteria bacterium]|nr:popeye domain-containing protein [Alphaproteobacteria bacterium]
MLETFSLQGDVWVHLAALFYVLGFWARDQLILRSLVLLGTAFYILYYYLAADMPLWSAMLWSTILGVVNLYVTVQLAMERTTFRMSRDERQLYSAFSPMTPGEFRKLMSMAIWHDAEQACLLTIESRPNKSLFYIIEGSVTLQKNGRAFDMNAGKFVGEISYLLMSNATATAHAHAATRYIEWRHEDLAEIERRNPGIRVALREILNADLAQKVTNAASGHCPCATSDRSKGARHSLIDQASAACA